MNTLIRLSISEAAKLFGVNPQTIRRAIKADELRYIVVRNRYRLDFQDVLRWSQKKTTMRNKVASKGIGQFVDQWKIKKTLFSPNPERLQS